MGVLEVVSRHASAELGEDAAEHLEYIASMIEDAAEVDGELLEELSECLAGLGMEDAAATTAAAAIVEELQAAPAAAGGEDGLKRLAEVTKIRAEYDVVELGLAQKEVVVNANERMVEGVTGRVTDSKAQARRRAQAAKAVAVNEQLAAELLAAKEAAITARRGGVEAMGTLETAAFDLPNPGDGPPLVEDVHLSLVPGRRYGLIGRNGKGKSTLLKWLAARREGANSAAWVSSTIH